MIEELITELAGQGLLGVLLCLSCWVLYRKDQRCCKLQEDRLEDMREVKDEYIVLVKEINITLDRLVSLIKSRNDNLNDIK